MYFAFTLLQFSLSGLIRKEIIQSKVLPLIRTKNIKLVVIDSIAALFRCEMGSLDQSQERAWILHQQAAILKQLSDENKIPILIINQVLFVVVVFLLLFFVVVVVVVVFILLLVLLLLLLRCCCILCLRLRFSFLSYSKVSDYFAHDGSDPSHSLPGKSSVVPSLGLQWANSINARLMLAKTNYTHTEEPMEESVPTAPNGNEIGDENGKHRKKRKLV
jgi:hypothetical protein